MGLQNNLVIDSDIPRAQFGSEGCASMLEPADQRLGGIPLDGPIHAQSPFRHSPARHRHIVSVDSAGV